MKKVAIVILNYKTFGETKNCLDSLLKVTYPNIEIVVVDNASGNGSLDEIAAHLTANNESFVRMDSDDLALGKSALQRVILFQSPSNRGFAAGNNWGIRIAMDRGADYVMLLNNDTIVNAGFLEPLVDFLEAHDDVGLCGPKIIGGDGKIDLHCARRRKTFWAHCRLLNLFYLMVYDDYRRAGIKIGMFYDYDFRQPMEVDVLSGACMLFKRSTFEKIGFLDENTFLMQEEYIVCEKMKAAGLITYVVPAAQIDHLWNCTTANEPSDFINRVSRESRLYYMEKYRGWNWMQRTFLELYPPRCLFKLWRKLKHKA